MARYTLELRDVVNEGVNIFNFPYPFYNESKRAKFENDFIRHFYFREICCDSVDKFRIFLEDKFQTVFPYYNKLFETAEIEYNILDNYNIKEEYTIKRENEGKTSGVSSTVGQVLDKQRNDTTENRSGENSLTGSKTDSHTENETVHSESTETGTETINLTKTSEGNSSVSKTTEGETNTTKTGEVSETGSNNNKKKYLDTPQGALDLDSIDYLTNLTQDSGSNTKKTNSSETISGEENRSETGTSEDSRTDKENGNNGSTKNGETDSERNLTSEDTQNDTLNGSESSEGTSSSIFDGEQRSTHDNNTRTEMVGSQVESSVYTKKGNIGVDTDSDMIMKHIRLQEILQKITLMFFEECEDLFMLVY